MNELKKKTLLKWAMRTTIAIVFFVYFWEFEWIHYIAYAYIPLNLFGIIYPLYLFNKYEKDLEVADTSENSLDTV